MLVVAEAGGWLAGKTHPARPGRPPLAARRLRLQPGSLVCLNSHAAHCVRHTGRDRPRRLAASWFYAKRSSETGLAQPPAWLPPLWQLRLARGELPAALARLMRNASDRALTGGRTTMQQR